MRKTACVSVAFLALGTASAFAADVSGTWAIQGQITPICTLRQQGNALTGACRGGAAEGALTGAVDGDTVRWVFSRTNLANGRTMVPVEFIGTLSGEGLAGELVMGQNRGRFTARRDANAAPVQLASAAPPPAPETVKPPPTALNPAAGPMPTPQQLAAMINQAPPRSVFDTDVDGSAVHQQSHMICPSAVAGFPRIGITMFDRVGLDVGCSYRNAAGSLITLYVYRALGRGTFDEDFNATRQSLSQVAPGSTPRDATGVMPTGAGWRGAGYTMPNGAQTELFLAPLSDWRAKFRATYAPRDAEAVSAAINALSGAVTKTAEPHLARCAAAPPAQHTGQRIRDDMKKLMSLSMIGVITVKKIVEGNQNGAVWCADGAFTNAPYLWWRNIQGGGASERVTNADGSGTVLIVPTSSLLENVAKGPLPIDKDTVFAVVVDSPKETAIAGFFTGPPTPTDVGNLVLRGSFGVYAKIDKPDGKATLFAPF
jgi:hypothetical protein